MKWLNTTITLHHIHGIFPTWYKYTDALKLSCYSYSCIMDRPAVTALICVSVYFRIAYRVTVCTSATVVIPLYVYKHRLYIYHKSAIYVQHFYVLISWMLSWEIYRNCPYNSLLTVTQLSRMVHSMTL